MAEAQQRSERDSFRSIPLTGCHQSMIPGYRSNAAFGRIEDFELDERGLCKPAAVAGGWGNPELCDTHGQWELGDEDEVVGVLNGDLQTATEDELAADAASYSVTYARHVRAQQTQNNMHGCQKTCTKYADANENAKKQSANV